MPIIECDLERLKAEKYGHWVEVFKRDYVTPVLFSESKCSSGSFARGDVKAVIASVDGENDGWGCEESGASPVAGTLEDLIRFGCTDEERERLQL